MPIRTVGEYLKRWEFTPHKPMKLAYEQNPKAVQRWLDEEYPEIRGRAKVEDAEIYWGDETGLRNDSQHERGYAPKGKTPVVRLNANRTSANMISAVTSQGKVRFRVFEGSMNADVLIDFCQRLIKCDLKAGVHSGKPARRKAQLERLWASQVPARVRSDLSVGTLGQ